MKIGIDATIACVKLKKDADVEKQEIELIEQLKYILNNLEKAYKDKKYTLVSSVGAIHRGTDRLHGHVRHLVTWTGKNVGGWNSKIRRDVSENLIFPSFTLKTTIYTEYDAKYSEQDLWSYGLKEYDNFEDIILREYFLNMTDESLEYYREVGHKRYVNAQKEHARNEERKQRAISERQEIYEYISANRSQYSDLDWSLPDPVAYEFRVIKLMINQYYEDKYEKTGQYSNFKMMSIKDIAYSYILYHRKELDFTMLAVTQLIN